MTYEEYKSKKSNKKSNNKLIIRLLNKLFTIVIFTMLVVIISNYSPKFRNFIINDVLNNSMNFSKVNNLIDNLTGIFKNKNETKSVANIITNNSEKYLDGIKYTFEGIEDVYLKDSGIITYIGNKEGYNNTIIVQQSNGYYAWYGNVKESVKLYDYVEAGNKIGTSEKEYYYVLLKDDKPININES